MAVEIISTQRLSLRSPVAGDLEILHQRIFSDAQVMCFVFGGVPLTIDQSSDFFTSAFDHGATGLKLCVLVEKACSEIIGFSGLIACDALNAEDYEIGFVLSRPAWGKGFATEIGQGQLDYGFGNVGCDRLLAQVAPENVPSINVLKKIGMAHHSNTHTKGRGLREVHVAYPK